jgi:hypothetical protein
LFTYSGNLSGTPAIVAPAGFATVLDKSTPGVVRVHLTADRIGTWNRDNFTPAELANPQVSGPAASPAGDGMTNLMKYALGFDPKVPRSESGISLNQGSCALVFQRPANRPDVTYSVEVSTDLKTWTTSGVTLSQIASGDPQTWQGSYPAGQGQQLFFRLRVTQP